MEEEEEEEESDEEEEEKSQMMAIEESGERPIQSHVLGSGRDSSDNKGKTSLSGEANQDAERQKRLQFFQKRN